MHVGNPNATPVRVRPPGSGVPDENRARFLRTKLLAAFDANHSGDRKTA